MASHEGCGRGKEDPEKGLEDLIWDDIFADDWEIFHEEEENERAGKSFAK